MISSSIMLVDAELLRLRGLSVADTERLMAHPL
jgi:hypothetical protein